MMETIEQLYREIGELTVRGDWAGIAERRQKLADLASDPDDKVDNLMQLGRLYHRKLDDAEKAIACYQQAVEHTSMPARLLPRLEAIYLQTGDHLTAINTVVRRAELTNDPDTWRRAARLTLEHLEDADKAMGYLKKAVTLALNHLNGIVEHTEHLALEQGDTDQLDALARELDDYHVRWRDSLAAAAESLIPEAPGPAEEAETAAETTPEAETAQSTEAVVEDEIEREPPGIDSDSLPYQPPKTEELSDNPSELRWEINHYRDKGEWGDSAARMLKLLNLTVDEEELWKLHFELGEMYLEKLPNQEEARFHLQAAHDLKPSSKVTLDSLAALYLRLEDWASLVEVKLQLCDVVEISQELSRHYTEIGRLYFNKLGEWNKALEFFNKALDKFPDNQQPFDEMVRLLVERQSWTVLEQNYRRMATRIEHDPVHSELRLTIAKALGKLLQTRLRSTERALVVYRQAQAEHPNDYWLQGSVAQALSEMAEEDPELLPDVIEESRKVIQYNPAQAAGYKILSTALRKSGQRDPAWVVASIISALGISDPDEQKIFEAHHKGIPEFDHMLQTAQLEEQLFTPLLRSPVASIFALVSDLFRKSLAPDTPRRFLKKKNRIPAGDNMLIDHCFKVVLSDAHVPLPEVYIDTETRGIRPFTTNPNCLMISQDWLKERERGELVFALGTQIATFLPQFYFLGIGPDMMANVIYAALSLTVPEFRAPESDEVDVLRKALDKLSSTSKEQLTGWCQDLMSRGTALNFNQWANHAERVSQRIGLLLCNDVAAALEVIQSHDFPVGLSRAELAHDLLAWAVSEDYFNLRRQLGITIQQFNTPAW